MSVDSSLSAADALAIRRDGAEATVRKLRSALDDSSTKDVSAKSALAKSDAVILELRSSVRQLKRQLEKVQDEKTAAEQHHNGVTQQLRRNAGGSNVNDSRAILSDQASVDHSQAADSRIGELQVQLDRAHAQMLTADMVRKELEDTLEAEQYTWELRVQDQERTIDQLQRECSVLANDLEQCRSQWKEAEDGWTEEVQELQNQLEKAQQEIAHWKSLNKGGDDDGSAGLKERLVALEQERNELQSCLDEALKELEAVDAELQGDNAGELHTENQRLQLLLKNKDDSILEPLQHLYRWVQERDGGENDVHASPRDARELLTAIQTHLERTPGNDKDLAATRQQVKDLEGQLFVYSGDLQAREESSAELRASLKEAVALLKPLQDAVSRADQEKANLRRQIDEMPTDGSGDSGREMVHARRSLKHKDEQIEELNRDIESLELQLSKAKVMAATSVIAAQKSASPETPVLSRAREELKAKRAAEKTLKQLLKDAQTRFNTLHQQNTEVEAMNNELQGRLHQAEEGLVIKPSAEDSEDLATRDANIHVMENKLLVAKGELARKDVELRGLRRELEQAKSAQAFEAGGEGKLFETEARVKELEARLSQTTAELKMKKESERKLNRSLKEALGLLKPLQMHLEEAEDEKSELRDELLALQKRTSEDPSVRSREVPNARNVEKISSLEKNVQQLEQENSQLHDALEDMSQSFNVSHLSGISKTSQKSESRLKEEVVEIKSRYEVTQSRLEDAYIENHTLVEALTQREQKEKEMAQEIQILRGELENAKFLATSALVKVEELTMANVEQRSLNDANAGGIDHDLLFKEKTREFDREMRAARRGGAKNNGKREKVPYRLT
jgi:chromosome segregation ATPase